jgi:hypothetical protein
MPNCIVCKNPNCARQPGIGDFARYNCPRCGVFALAGSAEAEIESKLAEKPLRASLMSHALQRMQRPGVQPRLITSDELPSFWREERLPTPQQQADNLILWIGNHQTTAFDYAENAMTAIAAIIGASISERGEAGFEWLNSELSQKDWYKLVDRTGGRIGLRLTIAGWERYNLLKKTSLESRTAFMAMKFGDAELNRVVDACFRPAVRRTGFELQLLTDRQPAGIIDDQIRAAILSARLVISDLSHGSHGAYWEAGFAEGLGLPVIYSCNKRVWDTEKTHFDTNHLVTILWDVENLPKAEAAMAATIRATLRADAKQTDD